MPEILEIASPQNPRYKNWLKLLDGRGIKKQSQAILAGRRFIEEVLAQYPQRAAALLVSTSCKPEETDSLAAALPENAPLYLLPPELFAALDIYGIKEPLLLLEAPPFPAWNGQLGAGLTVFLPFQNPINLGTCIRSAAAFGAEVVLLREAATPYLPKCLRAAGPAIFQTPIYQGPGLPDLAALDLPVYALSPRGVSIYNSLGQSAGQNTLPQCMGLVAGMEGPGLDSYWPQEKRLSIPMPGPVESLNAAVSMSIGMSFYNAVQANPANQLEEA